MAHQYQGQAVARYHPGRGWGRLGIHIPWPRAITPHHPGRVPPSGVGSSIESCKLQTTKVVMAGDAGRDQGPVCALKVMACKPLAHKAPNEM